MAMVGWLVSMPRSQYSKHQKIETNYEPRSFETNFIDHTIFDLFLYYIWLHSLTCPPWFRWKGSWKDGFLSPPDKFSWFHLQILIDTGWQRYKMYIFICILYVYNMSTAYIYIYICLPCGFPVSFVAVLRNKVSRPVRIFPAISKVYWWFLKLKAIHEMMDDRFSFYILMNRIDGL